MLVRSLGVLIGPLDCDLEAALAAYLKSSDFPYCYERLTVLGASQNNQRFKHCCMKR
jgi:hypothetical protein